MHEKGDPFPADHDQDYGQGQEEIDPYLPGRQFSMGGVQFYHAAALFVSQGIHRVCQARPDGLVTH